MQEAYLLEQVVRRLTNRTRPRQKSTLLILRPSLNPDKQKFLIHTTQRYWWQWQTQQHQLTVLIYPWFRTAVHTPGGGRADAGTSASVGGWAIFSVSGREGSQQIAMGREFLRTIVCVFVSRAEWTLQSRRFTRLQTYSVPIQGLCRVVAFKILHEIFDFFFDFMCLEAPRSTPIGTRCHPPVLPISPSAHVSGLRL